MTAISQNLSPFHLLAHAVLRTIYVGLILKLNSNVRWQVQNSDAARIFFVTSAVKDRCTIPTNRRQFK